MLRFYLSLEFVNSRHKNIFKLNKLTTCKVFNYKNKIWGVRLGNMANCSNSGSGIGCIVCNNFIQQTGQT